MGRNITVLNQIAAASGCFKEDRNKIEMIASAYGLFPKDIMNTAEKAGEIVLEIVKEESNHNLLEYLKNADSYTVEHSINVCFLSVIIGVMTGYNGEELLQIGQGALLHDIGKTKIPKKILNKKGSLTDKEYEVIKKHPQIGYMILKNTQKFNDCVLLTVLQHHERCDGSGYPYGLTQKDIHPFALITAVADVFDAVTTNRVYRKALTISEGFSLIMQMSEKKQLDRKLIDVFAKVF